MVVTLKKKKPMSSHEYNPSLNHPYYLPIAVGWIIGYFRANRFNLTLEYMGAEMPKPISGPGYRKVETASSPNYNNLLAAANVVGVKMKDLYAVGDIGSLALQAEEQSKAIIMTSVPATSAPWS